MGFQISIWEFLNAFSGVVNRFSINGNDGANRSGQGQKQTGFADRASSPAGFASKGADFVEGEPSLSAKVAAVPVNCSRSQRLGLDFPR